ncbi:MAG TPA: acylphosphatase [Pusillimonas sp.]
MKNLPPDHTVETVFVRVTGRVQGVGFRIAAVRQAHLLGITGWVRNTRDGAVEATLQGQVDPIDRMLSWLHVGPPGARVGEVNHSQITTQRHFDRFEQQ